MSQLTNLNVEWVSLVDRAAVRNPTNPAEPQRLLLWKSDSGDNNQGGNMTPEETTAALKKAEQERDAALATNTTLEARVAELEKAAKPPKPAEIDKSELPESVRVALEKAEQERDTLRKEAAESARIAKEERDIRVTREFIAKAEQFEALPLDAGTFGPILKAVSENLTSEQAAEINRVLKAADAQIQSGHVFREYGRSGGDRPSGGEGDALRKAEAKAAELRKAEPEMSRAEALKQAYRDPEVKAAYENSR